MAKTIDDELCAIDSLVFSHSKWRSMFASHVSIADVCGGRARAKPWRPDIEKVDLCPFLESETRHELRRGGS